MAELHVFAGKTNWRQPLRIGIRLEGGRFIRLCGHRGDSVIADSEPLQTSDFGEGGSIEVGDISESLPSGLLEADISKIRFIEGGFGQRIGLALLSREETFCFWIDDDEFRWGSWEDLCSAELAVGICPKLGSAFEDEEP
jgi:hypothetical protein